MTFVFLSKSKKEAKAADQKNKQEKGKQKRKRKRKKGEKKKKKKGEKKKKERRRKKRGKTKKRKKKKEKGAEKATTPESLTGARVHPKAKNKKKNGKCILCPKTEKKKKLIFHGFQGTKIAPRPARTADAFGMKICACRCGPKVGKSSRTNKKKQ